MKRTGPTPANGNNYILKIIKKFYKISRLVVKKSLYILGYLILLPISLLVPKKKNRVVLTSRFGDFEGNLKYFFLYLNNLEEKGLEFVFLTEKKAVYRQLQEGGFEAWLYPGFATILKLFRTNILIVDGNEWAKNLKYFILFKAKKVQVWHGTGLKTVGLLKPAIENLSKFRQMLKKEHTFYDILMLTSEFQVKARAKAFRYGKLLINGYPRNDQFFTNILSNDLDSKDQGIEMLRQHKNNGLTLVTYAPTWRKYNHTILHLDLDKLNDFAQKNGIMFVIKLHYKHACDFDTSSYSSIMEYDKYADAYPLLSLTDLLVTDYSSIYLDFLLVDKPIVFFPYDIENYIYYERELLLNYDETTPGPKCYNQNALHEEIHEHVVMGKDEYKQQRMQIRDQFFHYKDGNSSQRLWQAIQKDFLADAGSPGKGNKITGSKRSGHEENRTL